MASTISTPASRDLRDTPYGWITDIPPNVTINKERAVRMYLLSPKDLNGVPFNDRLIEYPGHTNYSNEYKERDVEWKAWQIHGGPVEYWKFMKREQEAGKPLPCTLLPYSYRPGARYDLSLASPPVLQDRYVGNSISLRDVTLALPTWIWNVCNVVLELLPLPRAPSSSPSAQRPAQAGPPNVSPTRTPPSARPSARPSA